MNSVAKDAVGDGAAHRCANCKLENYVVTIGSSVIGVRGWRMKNMRENLELAASISEVNRNEDAEKFGKKQDMEKEIQE